MSSVVISNSRLRNCIKNYIKQLEADKNEIQDKCISEEKFRLKRLNRLTFGLLGKANPSDDYVKNILKNVTWGEYSMASMSYSFTMSKIHGIKNISDSVNLLGEDVTITDEHAFLLRYYKD